MKEKNEKSSEYKVGVRRKSTLHERSLNLPAKSSRINQRSKGGKCVPINPLLAQLTISEVDSPLIEVFTVYFTRRSLWLVVLEQ